MEVLGDAEPVGDDERADPVGDAERPGERAGGNARAAPGTGAEPARAGSLIGGFSALCFLEVCFLAVGGAYAANQLSGLSQPKALPASSTTEASPSALPLALCFFTIATNSAKSI